MFSVEALPFLVILEALNESPPKVYHRLADAVPSLDLPTDNHRHTRRLRIRHPFVTHSAEINWGLYDDYEVVIVWRLNHHFHRDNDLPAIDDGNGNLDWYKNGMLHRDNDLPASVGADGRKEWYVNNEIHREGDLPAQESANGTKAWYKNFELHRDNDLPAIEYADGSKEWYRRGQRY